MDRIISEILYMEQTKNLPLETILHTVLSQYDFTPKKSNELQAAKSMDQSPPKSSNQPVAFSFLHR